ncbi:MAG TPA: beta-L-arabinofuranosidase domain-containing protein [Pirellulales bacterium]|nr:beta-L-arabinofuranosidase domain-containing protein [Pirellulales bacterium]
MKSRIVTMWLAVLLQPAIARPAGEPLSPVGFQHVRIDDAFWSPRVETNRAATIDANLRQCEITGRIKNFAVAGKLTPGKHEGALFNDSDVYKMLEGIAYALSTNRDPQLEERADAIIEQIAAAQQADGYLNTYYTLVEPQAKWQNIQYGHELYCAGHLIEAAVAYEQATGKGKLLDDARKFADEICSTFGEGRKCDTSGHEEIELALVKLWHATGDRKFLEQAKYFLDVRGRADLRRLFGQYAQDDKPVREQKDVAGHAVRAMYLYAAMADVAAATGDRELLDSLESIWHDVVERKMYITGGIGPSAHNEGFTVPYDLPNDSAYAETCAAIGMALWNHRLFLMTGDGKYADVLEREVYNGLLSGVSLSGDRFFYVNPLASKGNHHRVPWFDCSCCPTNIVRYIPAMGERAFAVRGDELWTVLYFGNETTVTLPGGKVQVLEQTRYPWEGEVQFTLSPEQPMNFDLKLRVPGWCRRANVKVNNSPVDARPDRGYVTLSRVWRPGDVITLSLEMPVERVYADPHVQADAGRAALQRGPIVYCLEGVDNDGQVRNLVLPREAKLDASFEPDLLGGVTVVHGEGLRVFGEDDRGTADAAGNGRFATEKVKFRAVPYFAWDNRAPGQMVVWLPESADLAEVHGENVELVSGIRVSASHCWPNDTVSALADGRLPSSSDDHNLPRMTWWDHRGTTEWVTYRFDQPRTIDSTAVYWFDDTGIGQCRVPESWRLFWLEGNDWKPIELPLGQVYQTALDQFNRVEFAKLTTRAIKLEAELQAGFSAGILEWQVPAPPPAPLKHAHAHNDYLHERPLLDALDHGFTSVEADVYLVDGQLLVAHTRGELKRDHTLKRLYLDPLRERAREGGGRLWRDGPALTLLVDIKADGEASYRALAKLLAEFDDIVSVVRDGRLETKAVTVVVSGDRAQEAIAGDRPRYVGIDGRLSDLDSEASSDLLPLISDNWTLHFRWRGDGPFPAAEKAKLHDAVRRAHARGRRLRFWATPENTALWRELLAAEVDLINTDDLAGLEILLREAWRLRHD